MKKEWLEKIKENWIYILAFLLIALFVWIYNGQGEVLVESDNGEVVTEGAEEAKIKEEEVKGTTSKKEEVEEVAVVTQAPAEPPAEPVEEVVEKKEVVTLSVVDQGSYEVEIVEGDSAFDVLLRAAATNGFKTGYKVYSFGRMVTQIGEVKAEGTNFWALYYNGESSMVGADDIVVKNGDVIKWGYESWAN